MGKDASSSRLPVRPALSAGSKCTVIVRAREIEIEIEIGGSHRGFLLWGLRSRSEIALVVVDPLPDGKMTHALRKKVFAICDYIIAR